jgi:hypothetical protein
MLLFDVVLVTAQKSTRQWHATATIVREHNILRSFLFLTKHTAATNLFFLQRRKNRRKRKQIEVKRTL